LINQRLRAFLFLLFCCPEGLISAR
jgi:hypothetical protein